MGRTSLVLAVVAAMVTVLVFAVPAFAANAERVDNLKEKSDPPGPNGIDEGLSPTAIDAPEDSTGELATDYIAHAQEVDTPGGHHLIAADENVNNQDPGDLVQFCRDADPGDLFAQAYCNRYDPDR